MRSLGIHAVVGVNERESDRPGTLYNTMLWLGPAGLLDKHRKLMPTQHERLFHGIGRGDDLRTVDTDCGRIGGLICWENRMPLARYAIYHQGPQIWVAPTADDSDGWIAYMRAIAIESGAFVVSVPQYIPRAAFPEDFPLALPEYEVFGNGGAVIVEPTGRIVAGPLYGEQGMLIHDCDLRLALAPPPVERLSSRREQLRPGSRQEAADPRYRIRPRSDTARGRGRRDRFAPKAVTRLRDGVAIASQHRPTGARSVLPLHKSSTKLTRLAGPSALAGLVSRGRLSIWARGG